MGTISDKLVYLDGTREQIKENLNKFGSNITENDTFRSYSNVINDIYDKLPKVSGNGSNFTLENAQNGKLDSFGMDGNTEQTTYSGKNLLGLTAGQTDTINNVEITITEDGYAKLNGTASANINKVYNWVINGSTYSPQQYTYSSNYVSGTASINFAINVRSGETQTSTSNQFNPSSLYINDTLRTTTFTPSGSGYITGIQFIINSGVTFNNFIVKLQIEKGSSATDYEPYVGGTPSPNPDYPQDVKVVENEQIVNVTGKNLISKQITSTTKNGVTITNNGNGTYTLNGKATANVSFDIYASELNLPTGEYILSGCPSDGSASTYKLAWNVGDVTNNDFGNGSSYNGSVNNRSVWITIYNNYQCNNLIFKPMIEESSTATTYEPYQSKDYEIDLGDIELCKIEDYKDVIFKNNQLSEYYDSTLDEDSWYIKKEIGKVVVDTSNITLRSNYTNIEYAEITKPNDFIGKDNYDDYNVYCSHAISDIKNAVKYAWDSTYRIGKITNKATENNLWLGFPKGTGLDNIKTALNGAVIYYQLATPTYEKITNETLISQLESIEAITGLNYFSVSNENNVLPTLYVSRLKELGKLE